MIPFYPTRWQFGLLFIATGLVSLPAWGQREHIRQFAGGAVLTTAGDTIKGSIEFHQHDDQLIVLDPVAGSRFLPAAQVAMFAVQGEQQYYWPNGGGWVRGSLLTGKRSALTEKVPYFLLDSTSVLLFRSYPWRETTRADRPERNVFFEQLTNGPYLLLRRQQLFNRVFDTFYLRDPKGKVSLLAKPRKDLLALFKPHAAAIEHFAREQKLDFTNARHLVALVNYINHLEKGQPE